MWAFDEVFTLTELVESSGVMYNTLKYRAVKMREQGMINMKHSGGIWIIFAKATEKEKLVRKWPKGNQKRVSGFCIEPGCFNPVRSRDMCEAHYARWLRARKRNRPSIPISKRKRSAKGRFMEEG